MEVAAVVVWQEQQLGCQMVSVIVAATGRRHNKSHSSRCKCRGWVAEISSSEINRKAEDSKLISANSNRLCIDNYHQGSWHKRKSCNTFDLRPDPQKRAMTHQMQPEPHATTLAINEPGPTAHCSACYCLLWFPVSACKHLQRADNNWRNFSTPTHGFCLGKAEGPRPASLWCMKIKELRGVYSQIQYIYI
jgi:hypothetical protein